MTLCGLKPHPGIKTAHCSLLTVVLNLSQFHPIETIFMFTAKLLNYCSH